MKDWQEQGCDFGHSQKCLIWHTLSHVICTVTRLAGAGSRELIGLSRANGIAGQGLSLTWADRWSRAEKAECYKQLQMWSFMTVCETSEKSSGHFHIQHNSEGNSAEINLCLILKQTKKKTNILQIRKRKHFACVFSDLGKTKCSLWTDSLSFSSSGRM